MVLGVDQGGGLTASQADGNEAQTVGQSCPRWQILGSHELRDGLIPRREHREGPCTKKDEIVIRRMTWRKQRFGREIVGMNTTLINIRRVRRDCAEGTAVVVFGLPDPSKNRLIFRFDTKLSDEEIFCPVISIK